MKRLILTFATAIFCLAAYAQIPITGTWEYYEQDSDSSSEDGVDTDMQMNATDLIVLKEDNSFDHSAKMEVVVQGKKDGKVINFTLTITAAIDGSWTKEGDILTLTPGKKSKPKVDVKSENFPVLLRMMLVKPITKEITKAIKEVDTYQILSVTDKELTLKDVPDPKAKKEQKLETMVLKRK